MKIYRCSICGNIVYHLKDSGVRVHCCGQEMKALDLKHEEMANEKHIPKVEVKDNLVKVQVGDILHPMTEEHLIEWIILHTNKGVKVKYLTHNDEPKTEFTLDAGEKALEVYEYCNLHGLWSTKL